MAVYRTIHTAFWTDSKVAEYLTPEDKYFMLYVLTNPLTNTLGCYEISKRVMSYDTGYTLETIDKLIDRFVNTHKLIQYDTSTRELFIENWGKYNWLLSDKTLTRILLDVAQIKSKSFVDLLINKLEEHYKKDIKKSLKNDGASMGHIRGSHAEQEQEHNKNKNITRTKQEQKTLSSDKHSTLLPVKKIVSYLNTKSNSTFKSSTPKTIECIQARFNEGFNEDDFYKVIDIKTSEWLGTDSEQYLRPITLFGTKFESYLNQKTVNRFSKDSQNQASHTDTPESIKRAQDIGIIMI